MPRKKENKGEDEEDPNYGEPDFDQDDDVVEEEGQRGVLVDDDRDGESASDDESDNEEDDDDDDDEEDKPDKDDDDDDDDKDEEDILDDELVVTHTKAKVKYYPSLFSQILTKYEKTALIGFRAQQVVSGAEIYVVTNSNDTPYSIAERELKENKLPYYIQRKLPDGNIISVKLDQLLDIF